MELEELDIHWDEPSNPGPNSGVSRWDNPSATTDFDNDGLLNWEEINIYLTDPFVADTDEDGVDDGTEVTNGTSSR